MNIAIETTLVPIQKVEKPILENLMQFYFYDFSEFNGADVTENGLYGEYPYTNYYWIEENRFPFFIYHNGKLAGFALVSHFLRDDQWYYSISEFFVLKKFRKLGVGSQAARTLFEHFKGDWEVTQIEANIPAQRFWRKVIGELTNEEYRESTREGKIVQHFSSNKGSETSD